MRLTLYRLHDIMTLRNFFFLYVPLQICIKYIQQGWAVYRTLCLHPSCTRVPFSPPRPTVAGLPRKIQIFREMLAFSQHVAFIGGKSAA